MNDIEHRLTALRQEIDLLKVALHTTATDEQRRWLFARLSECFKESIGLVEQRIRYTAAHLAAQQGLPHRHSAGEPHQV
jgi:hypothetical protein